MYFHTTSDLIGLVRDRFGLTVHRRSIERALVRQKKRPGPSRPRGLAVHLRRIDW